MLWRSLSEGDGAEWDSQALAAALALQEGGGTILEKETSQLSECTCSSQGQSAAHYRAASGLPKA